GRRRRHDLLSSYLPMTPLCISLPLMLFSLSLSLSLSLSFSFFAFLLCLLFFIEGFFVCKFSRPQLAYCIRQSKGKNKESLCWINTHTSTQTQHKHTQLHTLKPTHTHTHTLRHWFICSADNRK